MKKITQYIYILAVVLFIVLPVPYFHFFGGRYDTTNYENRELAEFPPLTADTVEFFPKAFEDWFNDHLPFRNQMLETVGKFCYEVLHSSSSDTVIVGKDGWLFYKGGQVNSEDPIGDYRGTNLFTPDELLTIRTRMIQARDELAARGMRFVIFIAPNKERMYAEYMPDSYGEPAQFGRMEQVVQFLRESTDLEVVCAWDDLQSFKQEHPDLPLYYRYDTHWNSLGAFVGTKTLTEVLGFEHVPMEQIELKDRGESVFDLARLIHLANYLTHDNYYQLKNYTPHDMKIEISPGGMEFRYETDYTAPGDKLFVIGDSFSTMSTEFYACHYKKAYMNFYYNYSLDLLEQEQPDTVVYETVERYLGNMLTFSITDGIGMPGQEGL